ncbi:MAG: lipopolysaccharide heptosyltransferase II [Lentisphaeria bacterium]
MMPIFLNAVQCDLSEADSLNILVIKPSSMGDVIHALPAVHLLRHQFPDAHITWVVNDSYAELVERSPDVDEVVLFRRKRWSKPRYWPELISMMRDLRHKKYDVAIDFQGLLRSSLIALFTGAPKRIGFRHAREGASVFYTEKILLPANINHALEKNAFLVRSAFNISTPLEMPELVSYPRAEKTAKSLLEDGEENGLADAVLAVAPVSRWASKTWPPEFFAGIIGAVADRSPGTRIWLVGTQEERSLGEKISELCTSGVVLNLMGQANFGILIELLRKSNVILTNDSGPMHLAAALGVPVVALFGPTAPELTGPYGEGHKVFCGVCSKGPCFMRECPFEAPACWKSVDRVEVTDTVIDYLRENNKNERAENT